MSGRQVPSGAIVSRQIGADEVIDVNGDGTVVPAVSVDFALLAVAVSPADACGFVLGFARLRDAVGPEVIGRSAW